MSEETSAKPEIDPSTWVEEYGDALYKFAYFRVNNAALAEDLVQETFLAAIKGQDRYNGKAAVKTWLTGILKNKVIDYYRKKNRTQSMQETANFFEREEADLFSEDGSWNYDNPNVPTDWNPAQVEKMNRKEFMQAFYQCSEKLPDKIRTVFIMREVDGFKSADICEQLDITPQNLWTILHRARMALRQCLEKNFFGQ